MPQTTTDRHTDREPVPVAVLLPPPRRGSRTLRADLHHPDRYGLTATTAAALLASYTEAGQLVVDLHASPVLRVAADWLDRPLTTPCTSAGRSPHLPVLIIDRLVEDDTTELHAMAERIRALRSALLPGGHLVIAVPAGPVKAPSGDHQHSTVDPVTEVIVAARAAGLTYQQHLVTVHEPVPEPPSGQLPAPLTTTRHPVTHSHLLVFRNGDIEAAEGDADV
jgi:hypothetical protein